jgi:hypothetical protein
MDRVRLFASLLTLLVAFILVAPVAAQCTDPDGGGTIAEGESPDGNRCLICRGSELEPLPVHTVCGEDQFECLEDGVYREECADEEGEIVCKLVNRSASCPGGFECARTEDGTFCLSACESDDDCRDGFECNALNSCVATSMPDMGVGAAEDMGSEPDVGTTDDMGSTPVPDMSDPPDLIDSVDQGASGDSGQSGMKPTESGCCFVASNRQDSPFGLVVAALVGLLFIRRSRES